MRKPGDLLFPHLIWEDGKRRWHISPERTWMGNTMRITLSCRECEDREMSRGWYNSTTKEVTVDSTNGTRKKGQLRWQLTSRDGPCIEWNDGSKWISANWKTWRLTAFGASLVTLLVGGSLYMTSAANRKAAEATVQLSASREETSAAKKRANEAIEEEAAETKKAANGVVDVADKRARNADEANRKAEQATDQAAASNEEESNMRENKNKRKSLTDFAGNTHAKRARMLNALVGIRRCS